MYSGVDGREMEVAIFCGIVYYQRLRHMVSDKFQVGAITASVHPAVSGYPVGCAGTVKYCKLGIFRLSSIFANFAEYIGTGTVK